MLNFEKINKMIDLIEDSQIMEGLTFNEFAMEFYSEVKIVPISRYLKTNNYEYEKGRRTFTIY